MQPISAKNLLKGIWASAPAGLAITNVVTDSREVEPGCIFIAIKGERVDGHDFAQQAYENGAALVVVERSVPTLPPDKTIQVPNVLSALIQMGANYRSEYSPILLGITGSVGKTGTKEFCAAIFSAFGETLKTQGNQNNEIGLPKTLFGLSNSTSYAVVEMGMQGQGEIRELTLAARPAGAIITKIGLAHIEQLGSLENVLKAKMEICEGLALGGLLVLCGDDELLRTAQWPQGLQVVFAGLSGQHNEVCATNIRKEAHGQLFDIEDEKFGSHSAFIPALGSHNIANALLAYTAATRLGLNAAQAAAALAAYQPAGTRQKLEEIRDILVVEDFYNAGPDSMRAALETLAEIPTKGRRIAVLGDMLELGVVSEDEHKQLGALAAKAGVQLLITVGPLAQLAAQQAQIRGVQTLECTQNEQAAQLLRSHAKAGDTVLLKASRGMKFEEILQQFRA